MTLDIFTNLVIFVLNLICYALCFRNEGTWRWKNGWLKLRFFTVQSNLFCAFASLLLVLTMTRHGAAHWAWVLKYVGTVSVTVTFLTVMLFLGPSVGYQYLLSGRDFFFHLCGPLLALISFCFLEGWYPLSFPLSLLGLLPVILYGLLYFLNVVVRGKWEDFYGFNKNGKWRISAAGMFVGGFLVCMLIRLLYSFS